jgi:hypothetical protein
MRRILPFIAAAVLLAVPAGAWAYRQATDDGTLSVKNGYGTVWIGGKDGNGARGALIGSVGDGIVTLTDVDDSSTDDVKVNGCDDAKVKPQPNQIVCASSGKIRFRIVGGRFRLKIQGDDVDLSVVGKGSIQLTGSDTDLEDNPIDDPGQYKLNDDPWKTLPLKKSTAQLGA